MDSVLSSHSTDSWLMVCVNERAVLLISYLGFGQCNNIKASLNKGYLASDSGNWFLLSLAVFVRGFTVHPISLLPHWWEKWVLCNTYPIWERKGRITVLCHSSLLKLSITSKITIGDLWLLGVVSWHTRLSNKGKLGGETTLLPLKQKGFSYATSFIDLFPWPVESIIYVEHFYSRIPL